MASALASSRRLRSAIVSSAARCSLLCASPTRARIRSASARAFAVERPAPPRPNIAPIATLSRTLSCLRGFTTWKVRAIPIRPIRWPAVAVMSRPLKAIVPAVGLSRPDTQLTRVVLPAPFGPMMPTISPRWMVRSISRMAIKPPKRLVMPRTSRRGSIT